MADYDDTYLVDGVDLHNYATRIEVAENLQSTPDPVGEDIVLPGRDGAIEVYGLPGQPRRPDSTASITFTMSLMGVDPDTGEFVGDDGSAEHYFARWDELVRLFHRRRFPIDHPRPDGTRRAYGHLEAGLAPSREPASPWFGRFSASVAIPAGHWEDLTDTSTGTVSLTTGGTLPLAVFAAATAPCTGLRVRFGAGSNPRLTLSTGYLGWAGVISSGRQLLVDAATGLTSQGTGTAWTPGYAGLDYSPGPGLFEIDPSEPLSAVLTHTGGGSMSVEVAGRRRYRSS
ncbi:hypothetical protein [Pseudonocardia broussonetiae]|uniref:Uncharacterized protein n=1 Tax=Pseudonocardia broussonetiae TaxID=2736640 RepID=A0A6M6JHX1_9PSEU|nr:hypothetical protein [Pseudonocardia broussonetiae]QJY46650.1 hypothetical protein HOP40_13175 [Pseudonocardia broussonetiae]